MTRHENTAVDVDDLQAMGTEAATVAEIAQRLHPTESDDLFDDDTSPLIRKVYGRGPNGETTLVETIDLEQYRDRPRATVGTIQVYTQQAIVAYVDPLLGVGASLWGDVDAAKITVILNDDTPDTPGWRDHRAELALKPSPEWTAWVSHNERGHSQEDFGYFLEEYLRYVTDPDGSTLLEVARTFQAHVGATFRRSHEAQSDTVSLTWQEQVDAKAGKSGTLDIPKEFTVRLRPFIGCDPIDITGGFNFKVASGQLSLSYRLLNLDDIKREAVEQVLTWVGEQLELHPIEGVAPKARR